ncbi:MAG: hypothetical protein WHT45_10395 [Ignavibacterium sp.]
MKEEERIVFEYLNKFKLGELIYEPKGKRPPDFSFGNIGIEVRRLNQSYDDKNGNKGLENFRISYLGMIENLIKEFETREISDSFWMSVRFKRNPRVKISSIRKKLKIELEKFLENYSDLPSEILIDEDFEFTLVKKSIKSKPVFEIASVLDFDAGGWVISLYIESINSYINEKTKKIIPFKDEYNSWWLLLVDMINFNPNSNEKEQIINSIKNLGAFDRIIVVNPLTLDKVLEF